MKIDSNLDSTSQLEKNVEFKQIPQTDAFQISLDSFQANTLEFGDFNLIVKVTGENVYTIHIDLDKEEKKHKMLQLNRQVTLVDSSGLLVDD